MSKKKIKKIKLYDVVKARARVYYLQNTKFYRSTSTKRLRKLLTRPVWEQSSSSFLEWGAQRELKRRAKIAKA
jgi:hypothetical protein